MTSQSQSLTHIKLQECVNQSLQNWHAFQQLLSGHGPHHAISAERI